MPRFINGGSCFLPEMVNARRISEFAGQIRKHLFDDARVCRCRGTVIEINAAEHIQILQYQMKMRDLLIPHFPASSGCRVSLRGRSRTERPYGCPVPG